jgi:hypothetical protein
MLNSFKFIQFINGWLPARLINKGLYSNINGNEYRMFAGGLLGVEKAEPDPLNLLANTSVGSKFY